MAPGLAARLAHRREHSDGAHRPHHPGIDGAVVPDVFGSRQLAGVRVAAWPRASLRALRIVESTATARIARIILVSTALSFLTFSAAVSWLA